MYRVTPIDDGSCNFSEHGKIVKNSRTSVDALEARLDYNLMFDLAIEVFLFNLFDLNLNF